MIAQSAGKPVLKALADAPVMKWLFAVLAGILDYLLPGTAQPVAVGVGVFLMIDTVTGFVAAWVRHKPISSRAFARVFVKVIGYGSCVVVASLLTQHVPGMGDYRSATVTGILTLILLTEGLSILENVVKMGINLPRGLMARLKARIEESEVPPPSGQGENNGS